MKRSACQTSCAAEKNPPPTTLTLTHFDFEPPNNDLDPWPWWPWYLTSLSDSDVGLWPWHWSGPLILMTVTCPFLIQGRKHHFHVRHWPSHWHTGPKILPLKLMREHNIVSSLFLDDCTCSFRCMQTDEIEKCQNIRNVIVPIIWQIKLWPKL